MDEPAVPAQPPNPGSGLGDRLLAALLAAANQRNITALVGISQPPLGVVVLPDLAAGVVIVDRGDDDAASLKGRLDAILRGHANGVLHLVLAGGTDADRTALSAADRDAPDPNRLGVYLLPAPGRLIRVAGRRLALLTRAAALVGRVDPLSPEQLAAHNATAQKGRDEAATFATALDHRPQWAIRILGGLCILMFALAHLWGQRSFNLANLQMGANSAALVRAGELWRLVSHAFLHGGPTHLVVNLIGLFSFGGFLEGLLGWRRVVLLYGLSALGGGLASAFIGQAQQSVGASGAIWGLMGAGIGIVLRREAILPPLISARLRPRLLSVLGLNVLLSFLPGIDLWAHLGGGLLGFLLAASGLLTRGLGPDHPPSDPGANPRWLRVCAGLVALMLALSVAVALAVGQPWRPQALWEPDQFT